MTPGTSVRETPANHQQTQRPAAPSISLPKGGGAIRGINEKCAANPVSGTGTESMSVPIATSLWRSGFGTQLSRSYDSGAGNGPFGFGRSLSLPSITWKIEKDLWQYLDAVDSDVFILSGEEDLVPIYRQDPEGTWIAGHQSLQRDAEEFWVPDASNHLLVHEDKLDGYRVRRYRLRVEGRFACIERWSKIGSHGDVHWRSISKDYITTWCASTAESRVVDPDFSHPVRSFRWPICETQGDKGNAVAYGYKPEDSARIYEDAVGNPLARAHERNSYVTRAAQRYLNRIRYGNRTPHFPALKRRRSLEPPAAPWPKAPATQPPDGNAWMFEAVLDYDDHDANAPTPKDAGIWPARMIRSRPIVPVSRRSYGTGQP